MRRADVPPGVVHSRELVPDQVVESLVEADMRQRQRHAFGGTLKPWRPETQEVKRRCFLGEAPLIAWPMGVEDRFRIIWQIARKQGDLRLPIIGLATHPF